jgi:hypothetical protein
MKHGVIPSPHAHSGIVVVGLVGAVFRNIPGPIWSCGDERSTCISSSGTRLAQRGKVKIMRSFLTG